MANTYVITSVTVVGDTLTVVGSVNGTPITVSTWLSAVGSGVLASVVSFQNAIYPLMLALYNATLPTAYPTLLGTFSK